MTSLSVGANIWVLEELYMKSLSRFGMKVMRRMDHSPAIHNDLFITTYIHIQQHLPDPSCTIHVT